MLHEHTCHFFYSRRM